MNYPEKLVCDPFVGEYYREMTPQEYEDQIQWYKDYIKKHEGDTSRRMEDYISYLKTWFSDNSCDGFPNFQQRYTLHKLPMPMNIYLYA